MKRLFVEMVSKYYNIIEAYCDLGDTDFVRTETLGVELIYIENNIFIIVFKKGTIKNSNNDFTTFRSQDEFYIYLIIDFCNEPMLYRNYLMKPNKIWDYLMQRNVDYSIQSDISVEHDKIVIFHTRYTHTNIELDLYDSIFEKLEDMKNEIAICNNKIIPEICAD